MNIEISRSLSPETEKALRALEEMVDNGTVDISNVITMYDIVYMILAAIVLVPIFIWCIKGLIGSVNEFVQGNQSVKMANHIISTAKAAQKKQSSGESVSLDELLEQLAAATTPKKRRSKNSSFDNITFQIQQALKEQRRQ